MLSALAVQRSNQRHQQDALPYRNHWHGRHFQDFLGLFPQLLFYLTTLGQVASDFAESQQFPILITQRRYHDVRPKSAAVFANTPAFVFEAPFAFGYFELHFSLALFDVLFGIKARKMLSDHLVGLPTFEAFCRGVPTQYSALRVQHYDSVILDTVDQ